jgi:putative ABC transport system permease protein
LIALYIQDELSFDRYHKNLNQLYRVAHTYNAAKVPSPTDYQIWGCAPIGAALAADFPEVLQVAQFTGRRSLLIQYGDVRFQETNAFFTDSTVFDLFSWKLLEGNPKKALAAPNTVVLTKSTAKKYFGGQDALGKTLVIDNGESFVITGIVEDVPLNSHFTFDVLVSMATFRKYRPDIFSAWGYVDFYTYFMVPKDFNPQAFMAKVPAFLKKHLSPGEQYAFKIEPVEDAYLHSQAVRQPGTTGSISNLYIFSTIAAFILLIACINFMNLSTARSMDRAKEVGVRKSVGANKSGLIRQFLAESILLSVVATLLALGIASAALPAFQELSGKEFSVTAFLSPGILVLLGGIAVVVGLLAGSYPALILSQFKPALVLKGIFRNSSQGVTIRKSLVVFQFSLSVALIAGSMVVFSQLHHLRSRDLGFNKEQMLVIDFDWDSKVQQDINTVKTALADIPFVISLSSQRTVPGGFFPKAHTEIEAPDGKMEAMGPDLYEIDYDFISNFGIQMVAGRPYSRDVQTDSTKAMIINETAAREWGYQNPTDIIGKKFSQWGKEGTVIGVVRNFNYRSLHHPIESLTLRLSPQYSTASLALRIKSNDLPGAIASVEKVWKEVAPQRPFLYSFLDESFNTQYRSDVRFGNLFAVFAGLGIFIACLGLFGLTTYTVEQRTKEIGIRKVLGASIGNVVSLLSGDFLKLVLLAIAIAVPISWYFMDKWLTEFSYRIIIGVNLFVLPAVLVMIAALVVVSWQAIRTALTDPVKSLRNE